MMGWTKLNHNPFTKQPIFDTSTIDDCYSFQSHLSLPILDDYVGELEFLRPCNLFHHAHSESQTKLNKTQRSSTPQQKRLQKR